MFEGVSSMILIWMFAVAYPLSSNDLCAYGSAILRSMRHYRWGGFNSITIPR